MNNHLLTVISSNGTHLGGLKPFSQESLKLESFGATEAPEEMEQPVEAQLFKLYPFQSWGVNNNAPVEYDKLINENTALLGAIIRKIDKIYAGGIEYGFLDENNNFQTKHDPEEQAFLEQYSTKQYLAGTITNVVRYNNMFPEIYFNEPKTNVLGFRSIHAPEIRLRLQNETTGKIDHAFQSKNWNRHIAADKVIVRPIIDELFDNIDNIREDKDNYRYIYKIDGPNTYYQYPPWYSAIAQKWYEQSMFIPEAIKSFLKRLVFVQFQIIFREDYMIRIYKDRWEEGDDKAKIAMLQERTDDISTNIQSAANAGKFTANLSFTDSSGEIVRGYEIIPFETATISTDFIEFMQEADQHLIWAVGEDPIGMGSHGKGSDAGSGKKAAFNSDMSTNQRIADAILAPFYFRKRYNKLDSKLVYRIKLPYLADMNQISMDKRNNQYQDQKPAQDATNN